MILKIKRLPHMGDLPLPNFATLGSAGMDLRSAMKFFSLQPGRRTLVQCGFCVSFPPGYEMQIRPRSGLAYKRGLTVLNSPGTVDSDYRGEIMVLMINHGFEAVHVNFGDRIAQAVFAKHERPIITQVEELDDTERGEGGLGSTGIG